ncbi:hypothetical protein DSM00_2214 [Leeuwenhoekiella aequorea]|uniref:Uncharacterized protein n=2 Tax=Flavobacteriia TaxID=117743 RepID=A0A4Q0P8Q0_9FLAO|nr:hypothetical protein DSM00_2214 [Leeuwenhoekiella aequorea]
MRAYYFKFTLIAITVETNPTIFDNTKLKYVN